MGTDVAIRDSAAPATVRLSTDQLQYIAHTEFVPKSMRGKLPAILACVAAGRELGIGDMVALRSIHVIDGRASFSAELMVQLVRKRGHSIQGNFSGDSCTVVGKRADNGDEMTVTWTTEMARAAGLLGKDNWKKYAPAMLWARAVSQLCRMLFADCFAGGTYTEEEVVDADLLAEDGDFHEVAAIAQDSAGDPSEESTDVPLDASAFAAPEVPGLEEPSPADTPVASPPQKKKLNVLVGQLRTAGHITTEQLYAATGREVELGEDGLAHWAPLRDGLSKDEASALIERLEKFAGNVGVAA